MKRIIKISRLKNRLIISLLIGTIAVLVYLLILEINGFEVDLYNLFIFLMLPELLTKLFLFFFCLTLTITSVIVFFSGYRSKSILFQIAAGLIVMFVIGIPEINKIRSSNLFDATNNPSLDTAKVIDLYEKALKMNDIRALANIAVHKNLPDSLQAKLSDSESIDIRRRIAWETDSKVILIKLSKDIDFEVRMAVATNKLTPLNIVDSLQNDSNEMVRNTAFSMYKARMK